MTAREALRHGVTLLEAAGVGNPRLDARLLLAHAAGLTQDALLREPGRLIDPAAYQPLLDRRAAREPVALILGWQEFWSLPFAVSGATLIPRPDSETLIEAALAAMPRHAVRTVLDLGVGTGCLLLALLTECPDAWGVGIDRAPAAAVLARRNAHALGLGKRAAFLCGDWAAAVQGRFSLVLSNPPYIRHDDLAGLMPDVVRYEASSALDGGIDGLAAYRAILGVLPGLLASGGMAVLELGAGQAAGVAALASAAGLREVDVRADLGGTARALVLRAA